ncbi:MAG TPA: trypsin-like peptidase domain-containing protein [Chitinophagaceae bacterium]|nr:trypsin-like peptidase domain-containing protein [Chitinophagaceae bacterium]
MFANAITKVSDFTRPVHSIVRTYGSKQIIPAAGTLFFVNEEACAITCKHILTSILDGNNKNTRFKQFADERNKIPHDSKYKKNLKGLELKYHYDESSIVQIKTTFMDCVDKMSGFTCDMHPEYDLGIIRFNGYSQLRYNNFATFLKDSNKIKQGDSLCRLGFPFPEFTNYRFNETTDDIEWTKEGMSSSPIFPLDGMVTRFLADKKGISGIELSTPGLLGQSGGPLFNQNGVIYGMQFSTKHLHLGFDMVDKEILINNKHKKVTDYSFIHLGQCVHVDVIKNFLREKKVKFYEA